MQLMQIKVQIKIKNTFNNGFKHNSNDAIILPTHLCIFYAISCLISSFIHQTVSEKTTKSLFSLTAGSSPDSTLNPAYKGRKREGGRRGGGGLYPNWDVPLEMSSL